MKEVRAVAFRYLTFADFYNMYKLPGAEKGGGGQSYIDLSVRSVPIQWWESFFSGVSGVRRSTQRHGPAWSFPVWSVGVGTTQPLKIYRRRGANVCVAAQKLNSSRSNRVHAWHPSNSFPTPIDPANTQELPEGLAVYLARTGDGQIWAGWFLHTKPCRDQGATRLLSDMFADPVQGNAGYIDVSAGQLRLDEDDASTPFFTPSGTGLRRSTRRTRGRAARDARRRRMEAAASRRTERNESEILSSLFDDDEGPDAAPAGRRRTTVQQTRIRNERAVRDLKELYQGRCQITGEKFTFRKRDGRLYCEAHHLVPLGEEGADDPFNIIIVSPLVHRMLHYGDVSGIDLSKMTDENKLEIMINDETYTISWHPEHAEHVRRYQNL